MIGYCIRVWWYFMESMLRCIYEFPLLEQNYKSPNYTFYLCLLGFRIDLHKKLPILLGLQFRNSSTLTLFFPFICFIPLLCTLYHLPYIVLVQTGWLDLRLGTWAPSSWLIMTFFFPLISFSQLHHCKLRQEVRAPRYLPGAQYNTVPDTQRERELSKLTEP